MRKREDFIAIKRFDLRRIGVELLASLFIILLLHILFIKEKVDYDPAYELNMVLRGIVFAAVTLVVLCEGIFMFDASFANRYPWHTAVKKRVLLLFVFALVWLVIIVIMADRFGDLFIEQRSMREENMRILMVLLVLFTIIYVCALIGWNYHLTLSKFIRDNERLNREKLELDYFALQDQLNPHFLFNNLSTLVAIIPNDQKAALSFAENFTDVYRYVLLRSKKKVVTLKSELNFIYSYIALQKQRVNGLVFESLVEEQFLDKKIPTLSLQFLIENAIKHNIIDSNNPLKIELTATKEHFIVKNNLRPKSSTYSTNTGLSNLSRRIELLNTNRELEVFCDKDYYIVKVPFIEERITDL
ncbi:histidine kinase [Marinilabiliaceae bacterium ANBcel2]|nr:histidine kinase [Marinilabiliaceae bacterium ANBcel2]